MTEPAPCPICQDVGGFHDEDVHAARPIAYGKALPLLVDVPLCRACGQPVNGPGKQGCRYPGHPSAEENVRTPTYMDNPKAVGAPAKSKWGYLPCGCRNDGFGGHIR